MTRYTALAARSTKQAAAAGWAGTKKTAFGTIRLSVGDGTAPVTEGPLAGDVYHMCKLPKGALIVGGRIFGSRISSGTSAGSTALQMVIGLEGPFTDGVGTTYVSYASGASALGYVSIDYSRVSGVRGESGMDVNLGGLLYTTGSILLTGDQNAVVNIVVSAVSFISASVLSLEVDYYMQTHV